MLVRTSWIFLNVAFILLGVIDASFLPQKLNSWFWQSSVVAKGWLFIDGGEIVAQFSGNSSGSSSVWNQQTIAIDLSKSWKTTDLSPVLTNKSSSVPIARRPDMWYDEAADLVYSMGGWQYNFSGPFYLDNPPVDLWGFKPSSDGSVTWQRQPWSSDPSSNRLAVNVFGSLNANSPKAHYSLGGSTITNPHVAFTGEEPVRELVTYDSQNKTWSSTIMPDNTFQYGEGQYIDTYGEEGVIIYFGGLGNTIKDLTTILIYDIHTRVFYRQNTTNAPINRIFFCSVGAKAAGNDSYEIFITGGSVKNSSGVPKNNLLPEERESLRSIYILTIPAFTWVKAPNPDPTWRSSHSCKNLNERQMIVIGGTQEDAPLAMEPRPNAIGIYDLVNLNWTDTYNPDAKPYTRASVVQDVYTNTSGQPSIWGDAALPGIFKVRAIQPTPTTSTIPVATGSPTLLSTSTAIPPPTKPQTNLMTIILASTLSATFTIALILILTIYLCKRSIALRRAENAIAALANSSKVPSSTNFYASENGSLPAEVHADRIWTEMLTTANYHEVEDNRVVPIWEIDGQERSWNGKEWIRRGSRADSASVYSVESRQTAGVFDFAHASSIHDSPTLRSPVIPLPSPVIPSPVHGSPSMKSMKSMRAPSVRSNVEDSLEWRRENYSERPQMRMPIPVSMPQRPVLNVVTNGDWI